MIYIIHNISKQLYGYDDLDESQMQAYNQQKADENYIDCRLPEEFEEWDSNLKDWVLNINKKNQNIINNIKSKINDLLIKYERYTIPFQYNKLTELQQNILMSFLNECYTLLNNITINSNIPVIPDFLKDNI